MSNGGIRSATKPDDLRKPRNRSSQTVPGLESGVQLRKAATFAPIDNPRAPTLPQKCAIIALTVAPRRASQTSAYTQTAGTALQQRRASSARAVAHKAGPKTARRHAYTAEERATWKSPALSRTSVRYAASMGTCRISAGELAAEGPSSSLTGK